MNVAVAVSVETPTRSRFRLSRRPIIVALVAKPLQVAQKRVAAAVNWQKPKDDASMDAELTAAYVGPDCDSLWLPGNLTLG